MLMRCHRLIRTPICILIFGVILAPVLCSPVSAQDGDRPMTWMDVQLAKRAGSFTPSPDGQWMLYTVSTPNWEEANSQTDIHLVNLREGYGSSRQLTYTEDKNESSSAMQWTKITFEASSIRSP